MRLSDSECRTLSDGSSIPRLGMGTWYLGEGRRPSSEEERALLAGIDAGLKLIDTAEMYGNGAAEELVSRVLTHRSRSDLFLVSKVYPHNAGKRNIFRSCENSLRRLGTDTLDLYLLHWRGSVPLQETVDCMERLVKEGKIRRWGVSNFDLEDMQDLFRCESGNHCVVNQVLYHLGSRGIEKVLLPWQAEHKVVTMAYCPMAQAGSLTRGLLNNPAVTRAAQQLGLTPMQTLLAFVLRQDQIVAIPRSGDTAHTLENAAVGNITMPPEIYQELDRAFPAPKHRVPLDMV